MRSRVLVCLLMVACGDDSAPTDAGTDVSVRDSGTDVGTDASTDGGVDAGLDTGVDAGTDAGVDAGSSCLDDHEAGDRYPAGDGCNFCDCNADGSSACTERECTSMGPGCTYDGTDYEYGERFDATDGVNECVCAASGLACTRRDAGLPEEGAILLEDANEQCGDDADFTPVAVLEGIPTDDFTSPFPYMRDRELYPETLPDTNVRVRIVYTDGFLVCRIPSPTQPALDIEVFVELITEDGAFDETFHTYLRRNNFGFVDAWLTVGSAPVGGLDGTYDPACLDPRGFSFSAQVNADGTTEGAVSKTCEVDILLDVARF